MAQSPSGRSSSVPDPIRLEAEGFYVSALAEALSNHSVWNGNTARTAPPESPHHGCDDIWARYALNYMHPGPFACEWYPVADDLPIRPLVTQVCEHVGATELGGVLITRIPPGASVKPHKDSGWHARTYEKFGLSVAANDKQAFCFEDKQLVTKPGDLFWFDNSFTHWVTNDSDEPRITCIICVKR